MKTGYCTSAAIIWVILTSISFGATYGGGSGTPADPYQIWTAEQMNTIGLNSGDWDKYFKLMADIDMSAYSGTSYNLIGMNDSSGFSGTFDGQGHVIGNLTYTTGGAVDNVGLFGYISGGNVSNVGLVNAVISSGGQFVGILAGINSGTITNCYAAGTVFGFAYVGGLAGGNYGGTITQSYAAGTATGAGDCTGGLTGYNLNGIITHCYATSVVRGSDHNVGGLAGANYDGTITHCFATGTVAGCSCVGGLAGYNSGSIMTCYSIGSVSGSYAGGLTGGNYGTAAGCLWDTQTSGKNKSAGAGNLSGISGKTTVDMKNRSVFVTAGWDFSTLDGDAADWRISANGYPRLSMENPYGGGDGTAANPYQIRTPQQMNAIGANPGDWACCFKLMADLDMSAYTGTQYNRIGDESALFIGTFNGCGYVIRNLTYTTTLAVHDVGLFGNIKGGTISNLGLENVLISTGGDWAGGIVGYMYYGTITSCYVTGSVSSSQGAGGLAGMIDCGTIHASYASGSVSCSNQYAGGVAGKSYYGHINSCYATGLVSGPFYLGGLVGFNSGFFTASIWDMQTSGQSVAAGYGLTAGTAGKTTIEMKTLSTFTNAGWDFLSTDGDAAEWRMYANDYPRIVWQPGSMTLQKCTVAAGKTLDRISFSGLLNVSANHFEIAAASGSSIVVGIHAPDMTAWQTLAFPVNASTFKKGKFTGKNANGSLSIDTQTGKLVFSAMNIDLAGLCCPFTAAVSVGDYTAAFEACEAVVNGTKPSPVQLLKGVKDTLTVSKYKKTDGKKPNTDSFTVQGTFTIHGHYDKANPLKITLGTETFEVSGGQFTDKNGILTCKKASLTNAVVDAKFDFTKCTYTLSVKNAEITGSGNVAFGINCFGVGLEGLAVVTLH